MADEIKEVCDDGKPCEYKTAYRNLFNKRADRVQDLQRKVWTAMDKRSCPSVYMTLACDAILEHGCAEIADLKKQVEQLRAENDSLQAARRVPDGYIVVRDTTESLSTNKLSDKLQYWRAMRPDEWSMDEFIRDAQVMEAMLAQTQRSKP